MSQHLQAYLPHGWCYRWEPMLVALHVVGNLGIALAYFAMPVMMVYLIRRQRALNVPWVPRWAIGLGLGYAAFILLCGITHVLKVVTIWHPIYWLEGWTSAVTALVSLAVAVSLYFIVPTILETPERWRQELTRQAQAKLDALAAENARLLALQHEKDVEIITLTKMLRPGTEGA